jgi:hypothetical protein
MAAQYWYDPNIQPVAENSRNAMLHQDDDAALDEWLASMSIGQFDRVMNFLMDRVYAEPSELSQPVA